MTRQNRSDVDALIEEARRSVRSWIATSHHDVSMRALMQRLADALATARSVPQPTGTSEGHVHAWTDNPLIRDHFCLGCGLSQSELAALPSVPTPTVEELARALTQVFRARWSDGQAVVMNHGTGSLGREVAEAVHALLARSGERP